MQRLSGQEGLPQPSGRGDVRRQRPVRPEYGLLAHDRFGIYPEFDQQRDRTLLYSSSTTCAISASAVPRTSRITTAWGRWAETAGVSAVRLWGLLRAAEARCFDPERRLKSSLPNTETPAAVRGRGSSIFRRGFIARLRPASGVSGSRGCRCRPTLRRRRPAPTESSVRASRPAAKRPSSGSG